MQPPFQIQFPEAICGNLKVFNECPKGYDYKIPFATATFTQCDFGDFLTQSVNGDGYWITLWSFFVKQDGYINLLVSKTYISVDLFLKGGLKIQIIGNGMLMATEKTYSIFYLPAGIQRLNLPKGNYMMLICIPPQYYFDNLAKEFPGPNNIVEHLSKQSDETSFVSNFKIPAGLWRIIKQLERTDKRGTELDIDLRSFMYQILSFYQSQYSSQRSNTYAVTTSEQKAIAVKNYISTRLGNIQLGGLKQIASQFYLTPKTLTREFKKLTGKAVSEFIRDERLELAKRIIENESMTVAVVAKMVGYTETTNFIRAFKKKFGYTPGNSNDTKG